MRRLTSAALVLVTAAPLVAGELSPPPGPIAPTGRFGPRVEIDALPYTITEPGSYYLGGNLTGVAGQNGIRVSAHDVTIDLNGFSLIGGTGTLRGVSVDQNIGQLTVRNGTISGWGAYGIFASDPGGHVFVDLRVRGSGLSGIAAGSHSIVSRCVAYDNAGIGIAGGVSAVIVDCTAYNNDQHGILAYSSVVRGCTARLNSLDGILVQNGAHVTDCTSHQNKRDGIRATQGCSIVANDCSANGNAGDGAGIHVADGNGTRVEANNCSLNDRGIEVASAGNLVIRNTLAANTTTFSIVAGNGVGTLVGATGVPSNLKPLANFSL